MDGPALRTRGLSLEIDGVRIVDDVTLDVACGEFVAVIGPNGAGKTSLLNLVNGIARPTAGSIEVLGQDVTRRAAHRRAALGLARTFQTSYLLLGLSVLENVRLMVQAATGRAEPGAGGPLGRGVNLLRRVSRSDATIARARAALDRVGLSAVADRDAGELSHGDRRKVELAIVIAARAQLVLLDEPMAGVNVEDVPGLIELIREVHTQTEATVVMVEHHLPVVLGLAQRVAVMHHGALIAIDEPAKVMADPTVQSAYVGQSV